MGMLALPRKRPLAAAKALSNARAEVEGEPAEFGVKQLKLQTRRVAALTAEEPIKHVLAEPYAAPKTTAF
jgi:hypothetical protein